MAQLMKLACLKVRLIFSFQIWIEGWGRRRNWCLYPLQLCHWWANFCNGPVYNLEKALAFRAWIRLLYILMYLESCNCLYEHVHVPLRYFGPDRFHFHHGEIVGGVTVVSFVRLFSQARWGLQWVGQITCATGSIGSQLRALKLFYIIIDKYLNWLFNLTLLNTSTFVCRNAGGF